MDGAAQLYNVGQNSGRRFLNLQKRFYHYITLCLASRCNPPASGRAMLMAIAGVAEVAEVEMAGVASLLCCPDLQQASQAKLIFTRAK